MIRELEDQGVVSKAHSPFNSPIWPVRKSDAEWRLTVDYRAVNEGTPPLSAASYGRVLLAEPRDGGARVALKLLSKERTARCSFLREFCTHLCLRGTLTCVQVLPLAFETPTEFGFAQELAPAGDLCGLLTPGVGLPEPQVKRCAAQVCAALSYLHGHALVHRDLKLDNVLAFDRECHLVKLGDFGLTRVLGWQVRPAAGPAPYAAPELWHLRAGEARLRLEPALDTWGKQRLGSVPLRVPGKLFPFFGPGSVGNALGVRPAGV
ncbi:PREDICTED: uncharacterized serine/threonine-protein kinase SBK3-like [Ficedula albicollis]|uniref:uncharacterized serine/threonine-protein kinase SBK3-like n=1 Tax=Ficedula albicollis TaxID=59894 RepID=UPI0007AD7FE2|nr:PREDICTED: uncharacterized serine/threonine-protein kinase SBK3-like [Ficedula albicollis]